MAENSITSTTAASETSSGHADGVHSTTTTESKTSLQTNLSPSKDSIATATAEDTGGTISNPNSPNVALRSGSKTTNCSSPHSSSSPSTPRHSRSYSSPTGLGDEDSPENLESEGEKYDSLKKKMKDRDNKKGWTGLLNIFSSSHHHKNSEMHKIFTSLPADEKLVDDYSCALQRDILIHGRLYVTQSWLCFYANIFSWETLLTIPFQSVQAITKEKTVLVIPNAIQIVASSEKYGFTSLANRDITYNIIFKCWQNSLLDQPMSPLELVQAARKAHGESTEVGSEADLWGNRQVVPSSDKAMLTKRMSMPTHLEIGRIPPSPTPSSISVDPILDKPTHLVESHKDKMEPVFCSLPLLDINTMDGCTLTEKSHTSTEDSSKSHGHSVPRLSNSNLPHHPTASSPTASEHYATPTLSIDGVDKISMGGMSMGGESLGSAEYETISLIEEMGEVPCGCPEHIGRTLINDVYNCDVETLFKFLFSDSDLMRDFNKSEKTTNMKMGEWYTQPDSSRLRDLSYTVALNYSFGPKFAHTTEHQIYSKGGQPGLKHIVNAEVASHNIPYGDTFYTVCRYCITRVAHNQTRFRLTANIKFKKSCWGLVKNLIERNAGDGLRTHFTHLAGMLKEYVAALPEKRKRARRKASRQSSSLRHRHKRSVTQNRSPTHSIHGSTHDRDVSDSGDNSNMARGLRSVSVATLQSLFSQGKNADDQGEKKQEKSRISSLPRVNLALTLLLGILIISNMMLYHHLMSYTPGSLGQVSLPSIPSLTNHYPLKDDDVGLDKEKHPPDHEEEEGGRPSSKEEWRKLYEEHLHMSIKETNRLKDVLFQFLHSLETIESSVVSAKKQLLLLLNDLSQKRSPTLYSDMQDSYKNTPPTNPSSGKANNRARG